MQNASNIHSIQLVRRLPGMAYAMLGSESTKLGTPANYLVTKERNEIDVRLYQRIMNTFYKGNKIAVFQGNESFETEGDSAKFTFPNVEGDKLSTALPDESKWNLSPGMDSFIVDIKHVKHPAKKDPSPWYLRKFLIPSERVGMQGKRTAI